MWYFGKLFGSELPSTNIESSQRASHDLRSWSYMAFDMQPLVVLFLYRLCTTIHIHVLIRFNNHKNEFSKSDNL